MKKQKFSKFANFEYKNIFRKISEEISTPKEFQKFLRDYLENKATINYNKLLIKIDRNLDDKTTETVFKISIFEKKSSKIGLNSIF